nr:hypothetical protein [Tanacetum cinerariifolium]
ERKARTTLLMALPEDHLAKFHKMADAQEMWKAIKSRFGCNDKSKKMKKYLLKDGFKMAGGHDFHEDKEVSQEDRKKVEDESKALVIIDGEDIDWSGYVEEDAQNYAMMAYSSGNPGSNNKEKSCSKACEESYARLKKLYDDQRDKLSDASVETSTSMPELVENASKVVCEPKVWTDAPIIEEYELDSDNDSVSNVQEDKEKPSFAFTDYVKHGTKLTLLIIKNLSVALLPLEVEMEDNWSDNGIEFKNKELIEFYGFKWIKKEYSNATTLHQNGDAERKNITLIEAARTMKSDSGFLVGYSLNSKAFKVYSLENKRVEENLDIDFLENKPNVVGKGHAWMFDLDYLTDSMNYEPVLVDNQANKSVGPKEANNSTGTQANDDQGDKIENNTVLKTCGKPVSNTAGPSRAFNNGELSYPDPFKYALLDDPSMLEDIYANPSEGIFTDSSYDDEGMVTDFNNSETTMSVSLTPTTRIHTIHPKTQILGDPKSAVQTRRKVHKNSKVHSLISQALEDESWVDVMQEELLQFQIQKDERSVVVRNKIRLVSQVHRQEERIDYDEVFAPVARIEAIRIFLAFASYMGFIVYQMDVKSVFLYGTIDKEVYVSQPLGFVDPKFPNKVYKVVKALYGLHQAPRA